MRKHETLRPAEDGMSVIVGILLLIVISVALATTVWYMVDRTRQETGLGQEVPDLAMRVDPVEPKAIVVRASNGLDWVRDLRFGGTCTPTLNGEPFPTMEGSLVKAEDVLGCNGGESISIRSAEDKGNVLLFRHTFQG